MKKFLLSAAALVAACAMNAQNGAPLYATGNFAASNWAPEAPVEFQWNGSEYKLTIGAVSAFKVSSTCGDWDTFNAGCVCIPTEGSVKNGTYDLVPGDANITLGYEDDWTVTINADLTSITLQSAGVETAAVIYLRGGMNEWAASPDWMFSSDNGENYVLANVEIPAGVEFKVADASWGSINYGYDAGVVYLDEDTPLQFNSQTNMTLDAEGYEGAVDVYFTLSTATLKVVKAGSGSVEAIEMSNNAAKVYYNLQGVEVANPANGLYIVKQGNKVSKVLVK